MSDTPTLDEYIASEDRNLFWRLSSGVDQNLLDEAIERIDAVTAERDRLQTYCNVLGLGEDGMSEYAKLKAENATLRGQLNAICEDGTQEHREAVRLRGELAQARVTLEYIGKVAGQVLPWESKLAEIKNTVAAATQGGEG
jgi:hypothetical protein